LKWNFLIKDTDAGTYADVATSQLKTAITFDATTAAEGLDVAK